MSYKSCNLCARRCGVNRERGEMGYCGMTSLSVCARSALHFWEEPVISGTNGSGTVFFSGCSLGCIFCQNSPISSGESGLAVTPERICEMMFELKEQGAHNINFVTPTHYAPTVKDAVLLAKTKGFDLPVVYNTGTYDTIDTIKMLEKTVDIYLPDFKYYMPKTAKEYSNAPDYPETAKTAISEMLKQAGSPLIEKGIMKRGVIVRILLLPGHVAEAKLTVKYLLETYGDDIYISLMNQYTPMKNMPSPLDRRVTHDEYNELVEYSLKKGLKNGFTQEFGTASESFIPMFDNTGVLK